MSNHPLIERSQNFTLDRKLLSVDSVDRDIIKYPNSSDFEVTCPQIYNNVESIRLLNMQTPNLFYNISERLQNNKLKVDLSGVGEKDIELDDGCYTPDQLAATLTYLFNKADGSSNFIVNYNEVNKKMYFGHKTKTFKLLFGEKLIYNNCSNSGYTNIFDQHSKWGLGAMLGFEKKTYEAGANSSDKQFAHEPSVWITSGSNILKSPNIVALPVDDI